MQPLFQQRPLVFPLLRGTQGLHHGRGQGGDGQEKDIPHKLPVLAAVVLIGDVAEYLLLRGLPVAAHKAVKVHAGVELDDVDELGKDRVGDAAAV